MEKIVIILFGPPGVGKGTQGKIVSRELTIPHIATGDIMREEVELRSPLGLKVKDFLGRGLLVPDEIVIDIIRERLKKDDTQKGFILDGFPRTVNQAESLDKLFSELNIKDYKVLYIDVPDEEILKRLSGRRICRNCQTAYNIYFNPPKKEGVCDVCGGELIRREDDSEEKVKKRLEVYKEQTLPVIQYYQRKNRKVIKIDGLGTVEEVKKRILSAVFDSGR
ncbi:Adenylate kinase [bacterium HR19]|nr:Adenylate kinase [bacterium HR19]